MKRMETKIIMNSSVFGRDSIHSPWFSRPVLYPAGHLGFGLSTVKLLYDFPFLIIVIDDNSLSVAVSSFSTCEDLLLFCHM